jgi:nitroreductase
LPAETKSLTGWYAMTSPTVENMVLTAVSLGLGTCCVGSFNEETKEELKIPEKFEVLLMLAIGYPGSN